MLTQLLGLPGPAVPWPWWTSDPESEPPPHQLECPVTWMVLFSLRPPWPSPVPRHPPRGQTAQGLDAEALTFVPAAEQAPASLRESAPSRPLETSPPQPGECPGSRGAAPCPHLHPKLCRSCTPPAPPPHPSLTRRTWVRTVRTGVTGGAPAWFPYTLSFHLWVSPPRPPAGLL